jgi:type IX secretion system PorP/SprF family membrane protein
LLFLGTGRSTAQNLELPADFRQHNLSAFNASLWNPTFSQDRNRPGSIALWTRWQWQAIDADPSSFFLNYTGNINAVSTLGAGFIQHNTGVFVQTGGVLNYVRSFTLGEGMKIAVGLNLLGYQRKLADDAFQPDEEVDFLISENGNFLVQMAPGVRFILDGFSLGLTASNLVDYNFTTKEGGFASDKSYSATLDYEIPLTFFGNGGDTFLRPGAYIRILPNLEDQYGAMALLSTPKFWGQLGYNSFYGVSGGVGATFFKQVSLGILAEFGTAGPVKEESPSIEFIAAFTFGKKQEEKLWSQEKFEETQAEHAKAEAERKAEEIKVAQQMEAVRQKELQRKTDSLDQIKLAEAEALKKKEPLGEAVTEGRYEEVVQQTGMEPGYYLIANVFGTKKYFENFMAELTKRGLQPKSFHRDTNGYNYVYLEKYGTLKEAEQARDSKFNGKYNESTWIFRVIGP